MMKSYTAYCMNEDGENLCMTREYTSKAHFISDLRGNGYKVHFVALTDKYDEECAKYHARLEKKRRESAIRRKCEREWKRRDAEIEKAVAEAVAAERAAEEATEEPTQEVQTMRASREFFTLEEKTRKADNHLNIVADSDTEYYVTNAPSDKDAVKLAMIKYAKKLESVGTPAAALLASAIRDAIKYEYFSADCGYNYSGNGGGALEICTDYIDEKTTLVYLRVAEILEEGEEPEEAEQYIAWCGMIENDVITEEYETLSEAIDEVETRYTKEEQKEIGVSYCRLLCNNKQWLECLEEKTVDDVYYF